MNRLTVICKTCGARVIVLDSYPLVVEAVASLLVWFATHSHNAFHTPGTKFDLQLKIEPILIETAQITTPANLKRN